MGAENAHSCPFAVGIVAVIGVAIAELIDAIAVLHVIDEVAGIDVAVGIAEGTLTLFAIVFP